MKSRLQKRTDAINAMEAETVVTEHTKTTERGKYDALRPGRNMATANLTLVEINDLTVDAIGSVASHAVPIHAAPIHKKYHSVLAMYAARKMRGTRQKLKTGQKVCHHLKMMLAIEPLPQHSISPGQVGASASQFRLGF